MEPFLKKQINELQEDLSNIQSKITSLQSYMNSFDKGNDLPYTVVIKELPKVIVFSCRMVVSSYDEYFEVIPKIGEDIGSVNPNFKCKEDPFYSFII